MGTLYGDAGAAASRMSADVSSRKVSATRPLLGAIFQQPVQQPSPRVPGLHFPELHLLFLPLTLALLKLQDSIAHLLQFCGRQCLDLFQDGLCFRAHAMNLTRAA